MMREPKPNYPDAPRGTTYEEGEVYQDFIRWQLQIQRGISLSQNVSRSYQFNMGENTQGIEIKFDGHTTNQRFFAHRGKPECRLSIEIAEKSSTDIPEWSSSGIYRLDNTWLYIQGNYEKAYAFCKKLLQRRHQWLKRRGLLELHEEFGTLRAFYLYESEAVEDACFIMEFHPEAQQAFHGGWAR